jgi:hypothetical protein
VLLMAGIRERDKRANSKFWISTAYGNHVPRLFYVRNMFFFAPGERQRKRLGTGPFPTSVPPFDTGVP